MNRADSCYAKGWPVDAVALSDSALVLVAKIDNVSIRDSLQSIIYSRQGVYYNAVPDWEKAVECFRKAIRSGGLGGGASTVFMIDNLDSLGRSLCLLTKDFDQAYEAFRRAYELKRKFYGPTSPEVARALQNLSEIYSRKGNSWKAQKLVSQAMDILKTRVQGGANDYETQYILSELYYRTADYASAESYQMRALAILEQDGDTLGYRAFKSVKLLASIVERLNDIERQENLLRRCMHIAESMYGPNNYRIATECGALARFYRFINRYQESEYRYRQVIAKLTSAGMQLPTDVANAYIGISRICENQARYIEGMAAADSALNVLMTNQLAESALLAEVYNCRGDFFRRLGQYDSAAVNCRIALDRRIIQGGPNFHHNAEPLTSLADLFLDQECYDSAECYYAAALHLRENVYGPHHVFLVYNLVGLGRVYNAVGRFMEADSVFIRAWAISQAAYNTNHRFTVWILHGLGDARFHMRHYDDARRFYDSARAIGQEVLGEKHVDVMAVTQRLAELYGVTGEYAKSAALYRHLTEDRLRFACDVFASLSDDERVAFIKGNPIVIPSLITLACATRSPALLDPATEMLVYGKGILVDASVTGRRIFSQSARPAIQAAIDHYTQTCQDISRLSSIVYRGYFTAGYADSLQRMLHTKDSLEVKLCQEEDVNFADWIHTGAVSDFVEAVPRGSCVLEYVRFRLSPFTLQQISGEAIPEDHYGVIIIDHMGPRAALDLGGAGVIDSLILRIRGMLKEDRSIARSSLAIKSEKRLADTTHRLYEIILKPTEHLLGETRRLIIVPDGKLSLLPFEILQTESGRYAIEDYTISYLACGRELIAQPPAQEIHAGRMMIMADPEYGTCQPSGSGKGPYFPEASYTQIEADAIMETVEAFTQIDVVYHKEKAASEEFFREEASGCRLLHLATHGFTDGVTQASSSRLSTGALLRAGVALAGANCATNGMNFTRNYCDDGILTAFEISQLNLSNNELTVLSACGSGLGEIVGGEGVFGLRRAFKIAGAQSLIISLWEIPALETRSLMEHFYRNWLSGEAKVDALRHSMLELITTLREKQGGAYPYFWGGFILAGRPE